MASLGAALGKAIAGYRDKDMKRSAEGLVDAVAALKAAEAERDSLRDALAALQYDMEKERRRSAANYDNARRALDEAEEERQRTRDAEARAAEAQTACGTLRSEYGALRREFERQHHALAAGPCRPTCASPTWSGSLPPLTPPGRKPC